MQERFLLILVLDFRLDSADEYKEWYKLDYKDAELHKEAVYTGFVR
jgi:N-acetyl-gamma-glutamylphosphate reductase